MLCFLTFSIKGNAQDSDYSTLSISKELIKNAREVVRLDYMKFVIENPKSATLHVKYAVTVLNSTSKAHIQSVGYDKHSKVTNLSAKVYDAFGKEVRKIKSKDFKDQSSISSFSIYEDDRVKVIELHHSSYPYTIEFEYKKTFKGLLSYPSSYLQSYGKSVENFEYIVETPNDLAIRFQAENIDIEPEIKKGEKKTVYSWKANNLEAIEYEPYAPYHEKIRPVVKVAPTKFQFDKYEGDMSTWNSFGQFMYDLNKGRDEVTPEMAQQIKEMTANAENDQEKIEILYQYLQDNMRYVSVQLGIGGWQTFDARYVEKNKYGDCKALSNFMKSILKEAGIQSYQTLIYSNNDNKIEMDEGFAFPGFANHVILNVPSENMWLECTSTNYPPNYIGSGNQDRPVLMLAEDGGKILRTPAPSIEENKRTSTVNFKIDGKGAAVIQKQTKYIGPQHDYFRYISNNLSTDDIEKRFLQNSALPAFTIDKLEIKNDEKKPVSIVDFHLTVPRYSSKAGRRIFIPLNKLNPFDDVPKVIEERVHPIHVKEAYKEEDTYTFNIPGDFEIESIPNKVINLESEFGKYQINIEVKDLEITYTRLLEIYAIELPADQYQKLRGFYKEIAKADGMKVVLVKKKA